MLGNKLSVVKSRKCIALFGDDFGMPQLVRYLPTSSINCLVAASIRPKTIELLARLAKCLRKPFLIQPSFASKNYPKFISDFAKLNNNLIVCHSYSMLLRQDLLNLANYNAVNIHLSLLPKNRGPNPIQWAIIKGGLFTGVSMHYMADDFDKMSDEQNYNLIRAQVVEH